MRAPGPHALAALLALASLANAGGAWAEPPAPATVERPFSAQITPDKLRLGEPFTLTLEVHAKAGERVELPKDLSLGPEVELLERSATEQPEADGTLFRFVLRASLFDLGEKQLADLTLRVTSPATSGALVIPGARLTGQSGLEDPEKAQIEDLLPPEGIWVRSWAPLWWLAGVLAAVGLGAWLWTRWRKRARRAPRARAAPVPYRPPHERALEALDALASDELPAKGQGREFFFRLSEILRDYLGERFGVAALDMTSDELLAALGKVRTPGLDYLGMQSFCREADLVKFAKAPAAVAFAKEAIEFAYEVVRRTTAFAAAPPAAQPPAPGATA